MFSIHCPEHTVNPSEEQEIYYSLFILKTKVLKNNRILPEQVSLQGTDNAKHSPSHKR